MANKTKGTSKMALTLLQDEPSVNRGGAPPGAGSSTASQEGEHCFSTALPIGGSRAGRDEAGA